MTVDGGGRGLGDLDPHRIVQEGIGDAPDFRRHGRGEEQRLPRERHQLADALDVGNEAHVQHAVGFVDDQQLDAGEQQAAALGVVEQAAGRGDQHVDAARQLGVLVAERNAADQERDVEFLAGAVASKFSLTCAASSRVGSRISVRGMRARARPFSSMVSIGSDEGRGLAGAGLGDAEHVLAGENVGDRLFLNGGGGGVTGGRHCGEDFFGQSEMGKGH